MTERQKQILRLLLGYSSSNLDDINETMGHSESHVEITEREIDEIKYMLFKPIKEAIAGLDEAIEEIKKAKEMAEEYINSKGNQ